MGVLRTVVMRAVETRATPENAAQYEYLEEVGRVNRAANESEEALLVVAVKKLGDMRLAQVTLEVKKPSAVARRALLLEAMAAGGAVSYTILLSPDARGGLEDGARAAQQRRL